MQESVTPKSARHIVWALYSSKMGIRLYLIVFKGRFISMILLLLFFKKI